MRKAIAAPTVHFKGKGESKPAPAASKPTVDPA
jgi:hypothetical protein